MKTTLAYGLDKGSTDLFYDLELLWKSFKFSWHATAGECKWIREEAVMEGPTGVRSTVICYMIHEEVTHL